MACLRCAPYGLGYAGQTQLAQYESKTLGAGPALSGAELPLTKAREMTRYLLVTIESQSHKGRLTWWLEPFVLSCQIGADQIGGELT